MPRWISSAFLWQSWASYKVDATTPRWPSDRWHNAPFLATTLLATLFSFLNLSAALGVRQVPSGVARKRSVQPKQITTLAEAQLVCKSQSVCGIPGRENTLDFECVDVSSTLDSCGGCVVPPPFSDAVRSKHTAGVDCGRLVGALEPQCSDSKCVVTKCRGGLVVSPKGTRCVPKASTRRLKRDIATAIVKTKLGNNAEEGLGE
ncbi:hypothetical protein H0H92_006729 [Tricholoma furcatifolium]|nr:hypothetical protein H0H92_006729 [Tricholoma furcatifolium]